MFGSVPYAYCMSAIEAYLNEARSARLFYSGFDSGLTLDSPIRTVNPTYVTGDASRQRQDRGLN